MPRTRNGSEVLTVARGLGIPASFAGGNDPRVYVPTDLPTIGILVIGGKPYLVQNANDAVLTSPTDDGSLLRTIDGGTKPIVSKVSTTVARIRFATYRMTAAGIVLAQAIVRVGIHGADLTGTTGPKSIVYSKGSGSLAVADHSMGIGAGAGELVTGSAGDLGLFDAEVTFGDTTGVKTITLAFGADQYVLSIDLT